MIIVDFLQGNFHILTYMTMIMFLTLAAKFNGYLSKHKLCPCMVRVPATVFAIAMVLLTSTFFSLENVPLLIPFLSCLALGSFLIGKPSDRFPILEKFGIASFVLGYLHFIGYINFSLSPIDTIPIMVFGASFWFYSIYLVQTTEFKFVELIGEILYSFLLFAMMATTFSSSVSVLLTFGIILYSMSEIGLQQVRLDNFGLYEEDIEYDLTLIYIISLCFFIMSVPNFLNV